MLIVHAQGAMDASNLLKPMLGRGELRCIGATTLDEYRKYIEKDPALERRFQQVYVGQPSVVDTIAILRGLKDRCGILSYLWAMSRARACTGASPSLCWPCGQCDASAHALAHYLIIVVLWMASCVRACTGGTPPLPRPWLSPRVVYLSSCTPLPCCSALAHRNLWDLPVGDVCSGHDSTCYIRHLAAARKMRTMSLKRPWVLRRYELHHGVRIADSALVDAAVLSDRYIADRYLPDKVPTVFDRVLQTSTLMREHPHTCSCRPGRPALSCAVPSHLQQKTW